MPQDKQKWLRLDADDGWQVVIPDFDSEPHSNDTKKTKKELAWISCPCKPKVNILDKIIVHNSFIDQKRILDSMEGIVGMHENPAEMDLI